MSQHVDNKNHIKPSSELTFSLCLLQDWALTRVDGPDCISYLQGQLTQDVAALTPAQHTLAGHCDAKGKLWSSLRLFRQNDGFAYLLRREVQQQQMAELKKYAVFSRLTIEADNSSVLLAAAGSLARQTLNRFFTILPDEAHPCVHSDQSTLLWLNQPAERFILIVSASVADRLLSELDDHRVDEIQWLALDIEAGLPIIDSVNSGKFIPQAVNLQCLDAINFKKGCYTGQEMVARAKYRGANKRALYWLSAVTHASITPAAGDVLELKLGDNWRRTGTVLCAVPLTDSELWIQAVLSNDLAANATLRPTGAEQVILSIRALPYPQES